MSCIVLKIVVSFGKELERIEGIKYGILKSKADEDLSHMKSYCKYSAHGDRSQDYKASNSSTKSASVLQYANEKQSEILKSMAETKRKKATQLRAQINKDTSISSDALFTAVSCGSLTQHNT